MPLCKAIPAPRVPQNSPADSISLSPSSHSGDTQCGGSPCKSPSYAVPRPALQQDTAPSPLTSREELSRAGWGREGGSCPPVPPAGQDQASSLPKVPFCLCSLHRCSSSGSAQPSPAHLQVPPWWARQPRERGKRRVVWQLLRSSIKRIAGPRLSRPLPRPIALPLWPCLPGGGCCPAFSWRGSSTPQNTAEPQAQGSLDIPGNREHPAAGTSPCKPGPVRAHPARPFLGCWASERG